MMKQAGINMLPYNINVPHNIYLILSVKNALSHRISLSHEDDPLAFWLQGADTPVPCVSLWDVMAVKGGQQNTVDLSRS